MAEPLHPFKYEGTGGSRENDRGFPVPRCSRFSWEKFREKDGAGIQETGVDGLTQYCSLTPNLLAYAFNTRRTVSSSFMCVSSSSFCDQ
jgi:hypothetical protein